MIFGGLFFISLLMFTVSYSLQPSHPPLRHPPVAAELVLSGGVPCLRQLFPSSVLGRRGVVVALTKPGEAVAPPRRLRQGTSGETRQKGGKMDR